MFKIYEAKTQKEIDQVIALRVEVLRKPWNQPAETATDELEQKSVNAFILNDNGKAIACGRLQENENKVGQIRFMAVSKDYQGKGLGKKMAQFLENKAKELGLHTVELQARENAVHFYESCGYVVKEKSFLLWGLIQHFLMEKKIPDSGFKN